MNEKKGRSLGLTIMIAMTLLIVATVGIVLFTIVYRVKQMQSELVGYNGKLGTRASEISSESMEKEVTERLIQIANDKASIVDSNFGHFKATVELLASDSTYLYEHADEFGRIPIDEPHAENDGKLVVHLTHSQDTDMEDPAVVDEIGLLGNEQNTLLSSHAGNPSMAKCYIATESGLMIEADRKSSDKLNKDGTVAFYEAKKRPWYCETRDIGSTHFTNITPEASGKRIGMMCGSPVTKNGKFMGVACAGMYLDDVDSLVNSTSLGENGITCIVNNQGQLLFTSDKTGTLTITKENATFDLRQDDDKGMADAVTDALNGVADCRKISFNDENYYIAFSPMTTVGWAFMIMLPEKTIMAPTTQLVGELSDITEDTEEYTQNTFKSMMINIVLIGVLAIIFAALIAFGMSKSIVAPVRKLTEKVRKIQGEDLDFDWDHEQRADEEIQTLAESFGSMTQRMKQYIDEVTRVTAEKERIGAELNVAAQIQADMLPRIFPPFPERNEFDLYATMKPAKEVGGDFYDFFMVDDDHLALVMADVSGKGVPAALFMVIAKTLIKNRTQMGATPSEALAYANEQLCEGNDAQLFVTVWMAVIQISTGKGVAVNAGHEHPALKRADGKWELIVYRHGPAVATIEGLKFASHEFELNKGDILYVYTDGVAEATRSDDTLYGSDRMIDALNASSTNDPQKLLEYVSNDINAFVGDAPQFDDITMMAVTWHGEGKGGQA